MEKVRYVNLTEFERRIRRDERNKIQQCRKKIRRFILQKALGLVLIISPLIALKAGLLYESNTKVIDVTSLCVVVLAGMYLLITNKKII